MRDLVHTAAFWAACLVALAGVLLLKLVAKAAVASAIRTTARLIETCCQ